MAELASNKLSKGESASPIEKSPSEQTQRVALSGPYADALFLQHSAAPAMAAIDHIKSKAAGGDNSYGNARVISQFWNNMLRAKGKK